MRPLTTWSICDILRNEVRGETQDGWKKRNEKGEGRKENFTIEKRGQGCGSKK